MDKLAVPEEILCIAKKLKEAQASLFLVGGSVRDLLLGIEPEEYDFEIFADPDLRKSFLQMEANHREQLVASFTSDVTSILAKVSEIKEVGKSFGVYKMKDKPYDFSFPRAEKKTGESRREYDVIINPFLDVSLAQKRRDLTINSLLYCPLTGQLIDHFGGLDDLKNGLLRHVDADTFTEDPLRVYRIAQFVARFGFSVDAQTLAISRQVNFNRLSLERIDAEWRKMIEASHVDQGLYFLYHADVLKKKHPEMELIINKNKDKVLSAGWFSPLTEVSAYEKKNGLVFVASAGRDYRTNDQFVGGCCQRNYE